MSKSIDKQSPQGLISIALVLLGLVFSYFDVGHHYVGVAVAAIGLAGIVSLSSQRKKG